ncbi:hypothetical protein ACFFMN_08730 [Planobispora siamensis]|uniref:Uncharacterized protein n=1 Tax=Planobispora siamensis TaxID=936338 RepID=A0A8J3S9B4_9ACTN|nr:hypothetical protein [Planobispora siamensis]GIH90581.1 hypothetical protein Psi01_12110 [Planobispora siamensis]
MRLTGVPGRWAVVAGLATAMVATASPSAGAADDVTVSPSRVEAGGTTEVTAQDCGEPAVATSDAFQADAQLTGGTAGNPAGTAQVAQGAELGRHVVEVTCQGSDVTLYGTFEIVAAEGPDTGGGGLALAGGAQDAGTSSADGAPVMIGGAAGVIAALTAAGGLVMARRRRAAKRD